MSTQRYSVTPHAIETLLTWVKSGEIAIPEIQRPFVWEATKVRNLLDSLYQGYPVGYLIAWRNPTVKLKDGTSAAGKRILIDGQQRVTALMAALLGREVLTKDYETVHIRIAFHPQEERFEVANPAIKKDVAWIEDVAEVFAPEASLTELTDTYSDKNPGADRRRISRVLEKLRKIINNHVGVIELADDLDIETVTEIFIRVNSAGTELSQADFAMSKIAVNESYGGNLLKGVLAFINKTHFDRITMILRSAGFVTSDLIGGRNAVNFAYILYLRGRAEGVPAADLERLVRRWYAMSVLRGRYTGSPETAFDFDIRQVEARGLADYTDAVIENELPDSFWPGMLPQLMDTSSAQTPYSSLIRRRR